MSTLALSSEYLSIIDIPGVKPLALSAFLHQLFASITSFSSCTFCACDVNPRLINRNIMLYSFSTSTESGMTLSHWNCTHFNTACSIGSKSSSCARLIDPGILPTIQNTGPSVTCTALYAPIRQNIHSLICNPDFDSSANS
jgi:hypothetical protein